MNHRELQEYEFVVLTQARKDAHDLAREHGFRQQERHESLTDYQRKLAEHIHRAAQPSA